MDLEMLKRFYSGKRVFVTGHTGFKGTWLLMLLNELGADVKGFALQAENPSLYFDIGGDQLCTSVIFDIREAARVEKELLDFQPDVVFHLAAQPLVLDSYSHPAYTFEVNAMGTIHVMEALRKLTKPCHVVLVTTDKVYENKEVLTPYKETDRLGGRDPYSASKAVAELAIRSYAWSFFQDHPVRIASARSGNVIGGGDWAANRIIPDVVRALREGTPVLVRNPHAVRPWQHVLDPIMGYLTLAMKLNDMSDQQPVAFNFGPDRENFLTVDQVVDKALSVWGAGKKEVIPNQSAPHEAGLLLLDSSQAFSILGWSPVFHQEEAIQVTMSWYKAVIGGQYAAAEMTRKNIRDYLNRQP